MTKAYIGIGSNLGDRRVNIDKAVACLSDSKEVKVTKTSSLYETEPVGGPPQGKYLNGVLEIETELSAFDLLELLNSIEVILGRVRDERNGPRTIDLDILLYGDIELDNPSLKIPHPRMYEREFVLRGLRELHENNNRIG